MKDTRVRTIWFMIGMFWALMTPLKGFAQEIVRTAPLYDVDAEYQKIQDEYNHLITRIPLSLRQKFDRPRGKSRGSLTQAQVALKKEYLSLKEKKRDIDFVYGLKEALNATYLEGDPHADLARLNHESGLIAQKLIPEIARLKAGYKIVGFPILHNMMIDIGVRQRGACKHWAEDLLADLRGMPRELFYVTWGEANPRKLTEHNVAVIYPKNRSFYEGLIVDPWRSKGVPFWVRVKADKHYKWNPWTDYGVY